MMTLETDLAPHNAPMAKVLSPLLMIGQWLCVFFFIILMLAAAFMAFPSGLRESLLSHSPRTVAPATMMGLSLASAIAVVGWFFILRLLRQVVIAVVHGDPFLPENIARLRNIWIIFAVIEIFRMITHLIFDGDSGSLLDIRLGTWFFIFVIIVISEAFRHGALLRAEGAALRAEQELTI